MILLSGKRQKSWKVVALLLFARSHYALGFAPEELSKSQRRLGVFRVRASSRSTEDTSPNPDPQNGLQFRKRIPSLLLSPVSGAFRRLKRSARSVLWPGTQPDNSFAEPLPPGSLGCPFFGNNILAGSKEKGPEYFYREASEHLGHPRLWKFYFFGVPVASVSGAELVQDLLSREFSTLRVMPEMYGYGDTKKKKHKPAIFGTNNLMFERDKDKHAVLRQLVGSGLTPSALRQALPTIQKLAEDCIDQMLSQSKSLRGPIKMENVCVDYTLEIVQSLLLGIDTLPQVERAVFREKLSTWLSALFSILPFLRIQFLVRMLRPYKARVYMEEKIEEKIESLLKNGPDASVLSTMLFATDSSAKLTEEQVIENALLLVAAGTDNSASSLILALFLLGLHPNAYQRLVEEQKSLLFEYNETALSYEQLEQESSPYLDAVVKETLRLGSVSGGFSRRTSETIVIDECQVPRGWAVFPNIRLTHQLDPVSRLPDDSHMDVRTGFVPERWLNPETTPTDFIPFGAGPRYCLGANLATLEIKVFLAVFARRVAAFELVGDNTKGLINWNPQTMIPRPADGVQIEIVEMRSVSESF